MTRITYAPLPGPIVARLRRGGPDAYGHPPERTRSDGAANPCRHCLDMVPEGAGVLILAHRPFDHLHPYAETGPIFLCADACAAWSGAGMPPILRASPHYLLKGCGAEERIRSGTGAVVAREDLAGQAAGLLGRDDIAFVDARSARNNCFMVRMRRATS